MREEIARAAARLFATRGYEATSIREIVEAVGVRKPTLYHYFTSKEELAKELLTGSMTRLIEASRRWVDEQPDPLLALEGVLEEHFRFCREEPDRSRFFYALFFGPTGSHLSSELATLVQRQQREVSRAVDRVADSGRIDHARRDRFHDAVRGVIVISTMDFLYKNASLPAGMASALVRDLLAGFASRQAEGNMLG